MQITILNVTQTTMPTAKGSYQQLEVAYKDGMGKVSAKKILSFNQATKQAFDVLAQSAAGEVYDVVSEKNAKGYSDWTSVTRSTGATPNAIVSAKASVSPKSTYETPEERAQRQIFIIRQSSIASAISALSVGAKAPPAVENILATAKKFEDFVFGRDAQPVVEHNPADDFPDVE